MSQALGTLNHRWSRWMSAHAHLIVDDIPRPRYSWRWCEVDVSRSHLQQLFRAGLIEREQPDSCRWRTTRECIDAIATYGRYPRDRVGCAPDGAA